MVPIYPIKKGEGLPKRLLERSQLTQKDVTGAVNEIIANVRANGDAALVEYAAKFDHVSLTTDGLRVAPEEVEAAYKAVDPALIVTMKKSRDNIIAFHEKQLERPGWIFSPIRRWDSWCARLPRSAYTSPAAPRRSPPPC